MAAAAFLNTDLGEDAVPHRFDVTDYPNGTALALNGLQTLHGEIETAAIQGAKSLIDEKGFDKLLP